MREVSGCAPELEAAPSAASRGDFQVEVLDVRRVDVTGSEVIDFVVDSPVIGAQSTTHVLHLQGWVLGVHEGVREIIVHERACDVRRIPVNQERSDVLAAYPEARAQICGFATHLAFLGADRVITYTLLAGMADGAEIVLCHIDVHVGSLGARANAEANPERLQPLMLTTLGRSGSTLVMGILSRHPEIVAYKPFEYEARVGRYWVDVFASLAQPGSYLQSIVPTNSSRPGWWLGHGDVLPGSHLPDQEMMTYLETDAIDEWAETCRKRIGSFYEHLGARSAKMSARYFAEKCAPDRSAALMRSLYPARREITLVRDLRDTICSILAINRKRGYSGFGRENVGTDEEYMKYLRVSAKQLLEVVKGENAKGDTLLLRYEDFMREPENKLREVLQFLHVDQSDNILTEMLMPAPPEVLAWHRTSADAIASIGRWQTEFTDSMRAAFREHLEDLSLQLGYAPTSSLIIDIPETIAPPIPNTSEAQALVAQVTPVDGANALAPQMNSSCASCE